MEDEKKTIVVPLPNEESPAELHPAQLSNSMHTMQSRLVTIAEMLAKNVDFGQTMSVMRSALESFADTLSKVYDFSVTMKPMLEAFQQISARISEAVRNIKIPELTEQRKQELLESHERWGQFGWSWFQNGPLNFYNTPPLNYNDANNSVKPLCSSQAIENLFDDLRQQNVNHADLELAIFCYRNKQYKACTLILFGLIDAKLIRKQPINVKRREVGSIAVGLLKGQFEEQKDEQAFYTILHSANLIACLETLFAPGKNFKKEPPIVNRNFVNHGMNQRKVRKRDCIQLFLALNNLLYFLDDLMLISNNK